MSEPGGEFRPSLPRRLASADRADRRRRVPACAPGLPDALPAEEVASVAGSAEVEFHREGDTITLRRAPNRCITCASCAAVPWRSSATAWCSTCSGQGSCSATARCSRACPRASARARPRGHAHLPDRRGRRGAGPRLCPGRRSGVRGSLAAHRAPAASSGRRSNIRRWPDEHPAHQRSPHWCAVSPSSAPTTMPRRRADGRVGRPPSSWRSAPGTSGSSATAICAPRVSPAGLSSDAPVSEVMTAPAYTVAPDRLGGGVLEMLDHDVSATSGDHRAAR